MSTQRRDPLPVFCFKVELAIPDSGKAQAYFKSVSGIKYETEVVEVVEGGVNHFVHRLPGTTKWSNLVLKRGFAKNSFELVKWRQDWLEGKGKRVSGSIVQLDTDLSEVCRWKFKDGWPCKWELAEFDASKSELVIETLEIAHHGLVFG